MSLGPAIDDELEVNAKAHELRSYYERQKTRVGLCFFIFVDLDHLLPSTLFNGETDL